MRPPLQVLSPVEKGEAWMLPLLTTIGEVHGGETVATLLAKWRTNTYLFWQVSQALIVTKIIIDRGERELFMLGMAGRGILRNADAILSDLKVVAREYSCRTIGGNVTSPGLKKLYSRLGCVEQYSYWNVEV